MLNAAESILTKQSIWKLYCWVTEENLRARHFYESNGFELIPDRSRLDAFSINGKPPLEVRNQDRSPNPMRGEFREVFYLKSLKIADNQSQHGSADQADC